MTYMRAIMRNDYDAALPLVASNQREVLKALALGQGPGTQPTLSADLEVGEVVVSGGSATVALVGRMCRTEARRNGPKPRSERIENQDPKDGLAGVPHPDGARPGLEGGVEQPRNGRGATVKRVPVWRYAWWLVVGALAGTGIAALLSIGVALLLLAGVLAVIGAHTPALRNRSMSAIPAGVGLAVLYLAWLNRDGPGNVCKSTGITTTCTDQVRPWPFVAVAVALVAVSVVLARGRPVRRGP